MQNVSREEKHLEAAVDHMLLRVNEMKSSVGTLLMKVEHEGMTLPTVLDSCALLSGQMNTLVRLLRSEKVPPLRCVALLPLALSPDRDPNLLISTEGRVPAFNHEVVPDYLRTKPDLDVETKHGAIEARAAQANHDTANKQAATLSKLSNHVVEAISTAREDWESAERAGLPTTSSPSDTQELARTLHTGKLFKPTPSPITSLPSRQTAMPVQNPKGPGPIKTIIKSGALHYGK